MSQVSGAATRPPSAEVPTTLGLSASEIPVFEGTLVTPPRQGRAWLVGAAIAGVAVLGVVIAVWSVGRRAGGDVTPAASPPMAQPEPEPTVTPIPEEPSAERDSPAVVHVQPDAGVAAVASEVEDAGAADVAAAKKVGATKKRVRKSKRTKVEVDAAPVDDDDLFDTRK